jgi:hypothetical protein
MKDLKQQAGDAALELPALRSLDRPGRPDAHRFEPDPEPRDKMPFEVEPVYLKLSYYKTMLAQRTLDSR